MSNGINIITGVTGQDGSYMIEHIYREESNSIIFGLARSIGTNRDLGSLSRQDFSVPYHVSDGSVQNLKQAYEDGIRVFILNCDFSSEDSVRRAFQQEIVPFLRASSVPNAFALKRKPISLYPLRMYCYHLGALSHVHESYADPELYLKTNTMGSFYLLRQFMNTFKNLDPHALKENKAFFYHAATTELFSGKPETVPQNSKTPFEPQTPYAVSKLAAYYLLKFELENSKGPHNVFLRQGILGNHESPRRPAKFVTQKIVRGVANFLKTGEKCSLGNLEAKRDWGFAPDYMRAIYWMMNESSPDTLVIGTGKQYSISEFIDITLKSYSRYLGGVSLSRDAIFSFNNKSFVRKQEVHSLCIDAEEAERAIGWTASYTLEDLVDIMVLRALVESELFFPKV